MKKFRYIITSAVVLTFLLNMATSCSKKKEEQTLTAEQQFVQELREAGVMPDKLPDGFKWFDGVRVELEDISKDVSYEICACGEEYWLLNTRFETGAEDEIIGIENELLVYDSAFKLITRKKYENSMIPKYNAFVGGDEVYVLGYDDNYQPVLFRTDPAKHDIIDDDPVALTKLTTDSGIWSGLAACRDQIVYYNSGEVIFVDPADESVVNKINISAAMEKAGIIDITDDILPVGENGLLMSGPSSHESEFNRTGYVYLDVSKGEAQSVEDMDFIDISVSNVIACDGQAYCVNDTGVFAVDFEKKTCKCELSFNFANCNRYALNNSQLITASGDEFLFMYGGFETDGNVPRQELFDFTAGTYDRAGQKVITVAATDELDYQTAEAICMFNDSDNGYFALFDDRYCVENDRTCLNPEDEVSDMRAYSEVSSKLSVDIIAGNGPDMLLTRGANEYLSSDKVFADLTPYIAEFKDDEYFTNVFEASKTNGKLYQLPLNFCVEGLISSPDMFEGKSGLSFDEYAVLVNDVCGREDPMYSYRIGFSRDILAEELFRNSSDLYIKDGKINVADDSFRALLDYCAGLPERGETVDMNDTEAILRLEKSRNALKVNMDKICCFNEFGQYHDKFGELALCGLPSADGRGACVLSDRTASVAADSKSVDACVALIRIMLSEEIQYNGADSDSIPINRAAMRTDAQEELDVLNCLEEDFNSNHNGGQPYDGSLIDEFEDLLSSVTTGTSSDHSILLIVYEEAQPYMCGQKSFDEVAKIINDRAQTVIDERK